MDYYQGAKWPEQNNHVHDGTSRKTLDYRSPICNTGVVRKGLQHMSNPILVEVTRGSQVESRHRASVAVALPSGELVLSLGDVEEPIYPRSAIKAFQALPLLANSGVDQMDLTDDEIALMCSSHFGEPVHVKVARQILRKACAVETELECGPQWPEADFGYELAATGARPAAIHNNCSGKHGAMLALATLMGVGTKGYVRQDHPVQVHIAAAIEAVCGAPVASAPCGIDGCSAPTWALPISAVATGFARFSGGEGLSAEYAKGAARIRDAVAASPYMVEGANGFCTGVMQQTKARAYVKNGAEGVMCAALPERNLGIAVKCDDGANRAAQVVMAHLLVAFGAIDPEQTSFGVFLSPDLFDRKGTKVGMVRASSNLAEALIGSSGSMIA